MKLIMITNNSLVYKNMSDMKIFSNIFFDENLFADDILKLSGRMIRDGHKLMMSPYLGNIPLYDLPYKTLILSEKYDVIDFHSLKIINGALIKAKKESEERTMGFWGRNDLDGLKKNDLVIVERWLVKICLPKLQKARSVKNEGVQY